MPARLCILWTVMRSAFQQRTGDWSQGLGTRPMCCPGGVREMLTACGCSGRRRAGGSWAGTSTCSPPSAAPRSDSMPRTTSSMCGSSRMAHGLGRTVTSSTRLSEQERASPRPLGRFEGRRHRRSKRSRDASPSLTRGRRGDPILIGSFRNWSQLGSQHLLHRRVSVRNRRATTAPSKRLQGAVAEYPSRVEQYFRRNLHRAQQGRAEKDNNRAAQPRGASK